MKQLKIFIQGEDIKIHSASGFRITACYYGKNFNFDIDQKIVKKILDRHKFPKKFSGNLSGETLASICNDLLVHNNKYCELEIKGNSIADINL